MAVGDDACRERHEALRRDLACHDGRIKQAEDDIVTLKLANARGTRLLLAAFFGSLIPGIGLVAIVANLVSKVKTQ